MAIKHFFAPVRHPSSVGLAERYVQVVLQGLRAVLQDSVDSILVWDTFLDKVVNTANSRNLRIHGFTPAQLLLGYDPNYLPTVQSGDEQLRQVAVAAEVEKLAIGERNIEEENYWRRLAQLDERRNNAIDARITDAAKRRQEDSWKAPKKGDLVLPRRLELDTQRGRKLEPRWEGPYVLSHINYHGRSGVLSAVHEQKIVGRYHINDMKLFVPRERNLIQNEQDWKTMAQQAEESRIQVEEILEEQEKAEAERANNETEMERDPDWWSQFVAYPDDTMEEQDPHCWSVRGVDLQSQAYRHFAA
ncbi:MAG: Platinum sensitivity protein [Watsoniomyces obsoletus]|nr:MAG: Platinum sensitivity protein [Watsoniomyces obsoletus]